MSVLLPAPFSPISAWIVPGAAAKSTLSSAIVRLKRFVMPAVISKVGAMRRAAALQVLPPEARAT